MRSVMTFVKTGRSIPDSDRVYWRLSALLARKLYPPLKLYADQESADKFVNEWGMVFDEIDTETIPREASKAHQMCWSAGKLVAMRSMAAQGQPFFHIDGDAFLFHRLGEPFESCRLFAQCMENRIKLSKSIYKRTSNYPLRELLPDLRMPRWMTAYSRLPSQAIVNMGIFGGTDCRAIYDFADIAIKTFVQDRHNSAQFKRFHKYNPHWIGIAAIAEQWSIGAYLWHHRIPLEVIMHRVDAFDLNRSHELPGHYCHIYTPCRQNPAYRNWAKRKLRDIINQPELLAA